MTTIKDCSAVTIDKTLMTSIEDNLLVERCSDVRLLDNPEEDNDGSSGNLDMLEDGNPYAEYVSNHIMLVSDCFSKEYERIQQKQKLLSTLVEEFSSAYSVSDSLPTIIFNKIFDLMDILAIGTRIPDKGVSDEKIKCMEPLGSDIFNYFQALRALYDPDVMMTIIYGPYDIMSQIQKIATVNGFNNIIAAKDIKYLLNKAVYKTAYKKIIDILLETFRGVATGSIVNNLALGVVENLTNLSHDQDLMSYCIDMNTGKHYFDKFTEKGCISELLSIMYPTVKRKNINKKVTFIFDKLRMYLK